jgi:hypothetical protein
MNPFFLQSAKRLVYPIPDEKQSERYDDVLSFESEITPLLVGFFQFL